MLEGVWAYRVWALGFRQIFQAVLRLVLRIFHDLGFRV